MPQLHKSRLITVLLMVICLLAFNAVAIHAQDEGVPTDVPTDVPTEVPTDIPTDIPTEVPTEVPTDVPTEVPTEVVTEETPVETVVPTEEATVVTPEPTADEGTVVAPVETTTAPLPAEPVLNLLVRETFDNGDISPWNANGWSLVGDPTNLVMEIANSNEPARLLKGLFSNVAVKASFRWNAGSAQISVRQSAVGAYTASIDSTGLVQLTRAGEVIGTALAPLPVAENNGWRTLRLSAIDTVIRVEVDGTEIIAVQDLFLMPPGDVNIAANFPPNEDGTVSGVLDADNFFLWVPQAEYGLYPAPTPIPAVEPVVEPTLEVTVEPTVEPTAEPTEEVTVVAPVEERPTNSGSGKLNQLVPPPSAAQILAHASSMSNDIFPGAVLNPNYPQNTNAGTANTDNVNADLAPPHLEAGEPQPLGCGFHVGKTVWFTFTPTIAGNYTFSLAGSAFDTVLAVYEGATVNALTQKGCNDDASATVFTSLLTLNGLSAGTPYRIQIGGFQNDYGDYTLTVQRIGVPLVAAPVLTTPVASATVITQTPILNWNPVANAFGYHLLVDNNSNFSSPEVNVTIAGTSHQVVPTLSLGLQYWKVQTLNSNGVGGAYSAARTFTVKNTAPALTAPAVDSVQTTVRPTFTYPTYGVGITYVIELSDTPSFTTPDFSYDNTTLSKVAVNSLHQGDWYWRVIAKDYLNTPSAPSASRKFTVNLMKAPAANQIFTTATTANIAFSWYATLPAPTVATYTVQVDTDGDGDFTTGVPQQKTCQPVALAGLTCTIVPGLGAGNYDWRVVVAGLDNTPALIPTRHFTVNPIVPVAPVLVNPALNATVADQTPQLDWNETTTVAGFPFKYNVQICNLATCTPASLVPGASATNLAALTYTVPVTLDTGANGVDKVYYWRVQTVNNVGVVSPYSAARKLTVRTAPPTLKTLLNGASTPSSTPTLTWLAYPGATYDIEIDDTINFNGVNKITQTGITTLSFVVPSLPAPLAQGTYFWHVRAVDGTTQHTPTAYSGPFQFTIGPTPPVAPVLVSPNTNTVIADQTPTFDWNASTGTLGQPYTYELQYATNAAFTQNVVNVPPAAATDFTPVSDLSAGVNGAGQVYYWHVRTINTFGGPGAYSAARMFTIRTAGPSPTAPADAAIVTDTTPTLTWAAYPGSTLYNIRIDTDIACDTSVGVFNSVAASFTPTLPLPQGTYYWCVQARDILNNAESLTDFGPIRSFTVDIQTAPANNAIITSAINSANVTFTWAAGGTGTTSYTLRYSPNPNLSGAVSITGITTTSKQVLGLTAGQYYWNVQAVGVDLTPPVAPPVVRQFTVTPSTPAAPVLLLPPPNSVIWTTTPTLTWNGTTTTTGGPFKYDLFICGNATCTVGVEPHLDLTSTNFPATLLNGIYYWKVRATNNFGVKSAYSAVWKFTISSPPVVPTLSAPANGSSTTVNMPTFTWLKPTGAVRYDIWFDNNLNPPTTLRNGVPITTTSFKPTFTLTNDTWYWQVQAYDAMGTPSGLSAVRSVKVVTPTSGAPLPNRFAPDNPSGYQTPKLTWGPISWTSGGGWYEVQVDDSPTFVAPVIYSSPHLATGTQSVAEGQSGFPVLPNGVYYWHVRACDSSGHCGAWSTNGSFSVDR